MTQSAKDEAKFLDTRLDDETAAVLEKWNLAILGAALLHDADHIRQAIRWHYKIPMQLWIINLAVYVLPTVGEFLLKNKRTSSFLTVAANGIVTSAAFLKVHLFKPTTDIWGARNTITSSSPRACGTRVSSSRASTGSTGRCCSTCPPWLSRRA